MKKKSRRQGQGIVTQDSQLQKNKILLSRFTFSLNEIWTKNIGVEKIRIKMLRYNR